jgi:hypothetical protein
MQQEYCKDINIFTILYHSSHHPAVWSKYVPHSIMIKSKELFWNLPGGKTKKETLVMTVSFHVDI